MEVTKNSTIIKIAAAITALSLSLVIILAGIFFVLEADHECEGENCPVCECIENCRATLKQIGTAVAVNIAISFSAVLFTDLNIRFLRVICKETPVSIKVRLNI